jgi:non-ribosomal peptide synthetase component F
MTAEQNDMFPASFAQQRLWFLDQLQPSNAAYNVSSVQRLRGAVNVYVLEESLNEIVRRHEALRTRFEDRDGEPMQVIEATLRLKLKVEDVSSESAREEAELEKIIEHHARQQTLIPFKLSEVPLLRVQLLRLGAEDHVLLLTLHHIVSDGWSVSILQGELAQLYEAYSAGQASPLAELGIQYADFSVWQREWLQGAVLEEQLSYWKEQLAGAPAVLTLPTDFARPAVQSNNGQSVAFVLERELTEGLKALSRQRNVTLFMTLLAAFQILLCRYSGQEDVVVGTPIAGRNREEIEPLIGFFVNTLVLRTKLQGNPRFAEVLEQVKEVALAAYAHQDVPFEKLV